MNYHNNDDILQCLILAGIIVICFCHYTNMSKLRLQNYFCSARLIKIKVKHPNRITKKKK